MYQNFVIQFQISLSLEKNRRKNHNFLTLFYQRTVEEGIAAKY